MDAVRQGLTQVGFVEGRNVGIEYRFAQSDSDRLSTLAAELVSRKVNVIVATGGELAGRAAAAATPSIPIVATFGSDPVEGGLVTSLNRPGRNLTGVSLFNVALAEKQVEVLHEAFPDLLWGSERFREPKSAGMRHNYIRSLSQLPFTPGHPPMSVFRHRLALALQVKRPFILHRQLVCAKPVVPWP